MFKTIILTTLLFSANVFSAEVKPYSEQAFKLALAEKKDIALAFHADWCGTCNNQEKTMMKILKPDEMKNLIVLKVDYDKESDLKKNYKVTKQSTLVLLKNGKESARSMGVTEDTKLKEFLSQ